MLDVETTPWKFFSEMREYLQCLKHNTAKLRKEQETLCVFLLVAIQDDGFDAIQWIIIEKPEIGIDDLLSDARTENTSLQMKEGVQKLQGDGSNTISRRTQSSSTIPNKNNNVMESIKAGNGLFLLSLLDGARQSAKNF